MRRLMWIACAGTVLLGGCSTGVIDQWADRGLLGVAKARANTMAFVSLQGEALAEREAADIDAAFGDLARAMQYHLDAAADKATTQPTTRPAVDKELAEVKAGLMVLLKTNRAADADLRAAERMALGNLDSTAECFDQIKRLRNSWGTQSEIDAKLSHLTTLVNTLLQERRSTP